MAKLLPLEEPKTPPQADISNIQYAVTYKNKKVVWAMFSALTDAENYVKYYTSKSSPIDFDIHRIEL